MKDISVEKIMTTVLFTINKNKTLAHVAQIFKEHSFHHIPIVDDEGSLKGIISLTDFERIKAGSTLFRNPKLEEYNEVLYQSLLADDIMTKDVVELQPSDSIRNAYDLFKENRFRALPVVDKGKLVGIVTPLDILDYFFK